MTYSVDDDEKRRQSYHSHRHHSIFFPLLLVTIGIFLFLNNMGYIEGNTWDIVIRLWPLLFIVGGLDSIFSGNGYVGSMIQIAIGVFILMWNLDYLKYININGWEILRLWPVLLIAWGMDIVIGRRGFISAFVGIILGLALTGGVIWMIMNPGLIHQTATPQSISQALEKAKRVSVSIDLGVGNIIMSGGTKYSNLLEGTIYAENSEDVAQTYSISDEKGVYRLERSEYRFPSGFIPHNSWIFKLNPVVPLQLNLQMGVGRQVIDLTQVSVTDLDMEMGVGEIDLTLPQMGDFEGDVHGAVGLTVIRVPKSAAVRIEIDKGLATLNYPGNYTYLNDTLTSPDARKATNIIKLSIEQPVGSIVVQQIP